MSDKNKLMKFKVMIVLIEGSVKLFDRKILTWFKIYLNWGNYEFSKCFELIDSQINWSHDLGLASRVSKAKIILKQ
jgi:hypothetical protein